MSAGQGGTVRLWLLAWSDAIGLICGLLRDLAGRS
jgi:hypothetical protein